MLLPQTRFGRLTRPRLVLMGALGGLSLGLWLGIARREDEEEADQINRAATHSNELVFKLHEEGRRRFRAEADVAELEARVQELTADDVVEVNEPPAPEDIVDEIPEEKAEVRKRS